MRDFDEWKDFVELSQRRNILTHNGGVVSEQYLMVCRKAGYVFAKDLAVGSMLDVDTKYLGKALVIVQKVGFMLAHTLWRKLFPAEFSQAHTAANNAIYKLLQRKRWSVAAELGRFSLSHPMMKNISDMDKRIRIVNAAIATKFKGDDAGCKRILTEQDWSASTREFKLAVAVLTEDWIRAILIMKDIGKQGEIISQLDYHQWPLFKDFRLREDFIATYQLIYGLSFVKALINEEKCETSSAVSDARIVSALSNDHVQAVIEGDHTAGADEAKVST